MANKTYLWTIGTIFLAYVILALILSDVFLAKEFNMGYKVFSLAIVSLILLIYCIYYFLKIEIKNNFSNIIIYSLMFALVFSISFQLIIKTKEKWQENLVAAENPLYSDFLTIAKNYNLDLNFTRHVRNQRFPINYKKHDIFYEKAKSIDILFFGDSTLAWGVIPSVIEQITGKKIAIYAYEGNFLNAKTAKLFDKIAKYYLKDNGIVVLSFDNWTQERSSDELGALYSGWHEMIEWGDKNFKAYNKSLEDNLYNRYLSFTAFNSIYNLISLKLKENGLYLKSPKIYEEYMEKYINPSWHSMKDQSNLANSKFLKWDNNSITLYDPEYSLKSLYSDIKADLNYQDDNLKFNSKEVLKIHGKNKFYMVPIFSELNSYATSRGIYELYYKNENVGLIDLGMIHPKDSQYIMQSKSHMGNTGGLMKSILIGKALRNII